MFENLSLRVFLVLPHCVSVCVRLCPCVCQRLSGVKNACKFSGVKLSSAMKVNTWICTCLSSINSG